LNTYIDALINKGITPGISLLAGRRDYVCLDRCYGYRALVPKKEPLTENTIYDVASLTKPLVTAFLIHYLVQCRLLRMETRVTDIFPHLKNLGEITILHLLTHTSGLPGWYPLYLFADEYLELYARIPLHGRPGKQVNYSCPGYILLYYIIQEVSRTPYTELAQDIIFQPLALQDTFFTVPPELIPRIAPTEKGNADEKQSALLWASKTAKGKYLSLVESFPWRAELIRGETNDLYSHHLGGTAGNAGLFSSCADIFRLCREFYPDSAFILKPPSITAYWKNFTPFKRSHRSAGFKLNSSLLSSGGRTFSRQAIGHNGFTGTCVWLDVDQTVVVILTNRIHPQVREINFSRIQKKINKQVRIMLQETSK